MPVQVTDEIEATVRALLQGHTAEFRQRNADMDRARENLAAYKAMVSAAFLLAVQYKFSKETPQDEIVDYVAGIRARSDELPDTIDPTAAERLISSVFTGESISDIDTGDEVTIEMLFATAIVNDEGIEGQLFEQFITASRKFADELLS